MAVAQQVQWATFISRHCRYGFGPGTKFDGLRTFFGAINGGYSELNLVQKGMLLVMVKWRILGVLQLFHGDILWIVPSRNMKLCWLGFPPNMWLNGGM